MANEQKLTDYLTPFSATGESGEFVEIKIRPDVEESKTEQPEELVPAKVELSVEPKIEAVEVDNEMEFEEESEDRQKFPWTRSCEIGFAIIVVVISVVWFFLFRNLKQNQKNVAAQKNAIIESEFGANLRIPAGALDENQKIEISRSSEGAVTDLFQLKPTGTKFLKPVTIEIPFKLTGLGKNQKPENIILEMWTSSTSAPAGRIAKKRLKFKVDKEKNLLIAELNAF